MPAPTDGELPNTLPQQPPSEPTVWVPLSRDRVTGQLCDWTQVPAATAAQWDVRRWH